MGRKRIPLAVAALVAVSGVLVAPSAATAAPALSWTPCAGVDGFECATADLPLDYAAPDKGTTQIAVIRHKATDPAHRIGSLFFNPGGPGGSGTASLPPLYQQFPAQLRARFDLVSFDPRGIGKSTPLRCFETTEDEQKFLAGLPSVPVTPAQQDQWIQRFGQFDQHCAQRADPLLAHDSTADVARDMDLLRQAVGDSGLNYIGPSYGSYLGATYANLFPDKVRAISLDGDVDPTAWVTPSPLKSTFLRLGSEKGSAATLNQFLTLCGKAKSCAFSAGSPAATTAKLQTLLRRLAAHPVIIGTGPNATTVTKDVLIEAAVQALYEIHPIPGIAAGWPAWAEQLQAIWTASESGKPARMNTLLTKSIPRLPALGASYAGMEQQLGVFCGESPNPQNPQLYKVQSALATAQSGIAGYPWTWLAEPCAGWPGRAAQPYNGPWNSRTAKPILVIGNTYDPATPYSGAVAMSSQLADARLLTVHGYGHTALLNRSTCADNAETSYFIDGTLPAKGTTCTQDEPPFAP